MLKPAHKKTLVLLVMFVFPLVAYLFFASGVNHFGRLPVLEDKVADISQLSDDHSFQDRITILGFLGEHPARKKGNAFNLNQKIYKPFYEFHDFQIVMVLPRGAESEAAQLKKELGGFSDVSKWKFVFGDAVEVKRIFDSLGTDYQLQPDLSSPYVFIIDKEGKLRGRTEDEDEGVKYGFDATSVADLNNKMEDDVKIILAEYRLALKKNNAKRDK